MENNSTLLQDENNGSSNPVSLSNPYNNDSYEGPCAETIAFITRFAHAFYGGTATCPVKVILN